MASEELPCYLRAQGCARSSVYFCIPVDVNVAKCSPIMAELIKYSGLVDLPSGVSSEGFQMWCTTSPEQFSSYNPEELASGLAVAQALGDTEKTQSIVKELAARVWKRTRKGSDDNKKAQSIMSILSPEFRRLVMQETREPDFVLLSCWPLSVQHEIINTHISSSSNSCIIVTPVGTDPYSASSNLISQDTLSLLSRTTHATPGLRRLRVHAPVATPVAASLLSNAILHHSTSLSHLSIHRLAWDGPTSADCISPAAPAETLFRILPSITTLTSLCVSITAMNAESPSVTTRTVRALADAISALPALARAALIKDETTADREERLYSRRVTSTATKHRCIGTYVVECSGESDPVCLDPVLAALSAAPALTALLFHWEPSSKTMPPLLPVMALPGPFAQLKHLHIRDGGPFPYSRNKRPRDAAPAVPRAVTLQLPPLPALRTVLFECDGAGETKTANGALVAAVLKQLGYRIVNGKQSESGLLGVAFSRTDFVRWEEVSNDAKSFFDGEGAGRRVDAIWQFLSERGAGSVNRPSCVESTDGIDARVGSVAGVAHSSCDGAQMHEAQCAERLPAERNEPFHALVNADEPEFTVSALSCLKHIKTPFHLTVSIRNSVFIKDVFGSDQPLMHALSSMHLLRELTVDCLGMYIEHGPGCHRTVPAYQALMDTPLRQLTQLTGLSVLHDTEGALVSELSEQLTVLVNLRRLRVTGMYAEPGVTASTAACIAPLTRLTELELGFQKVDAEAVRVVAAHAAAAPGLRQCRLWETGVLARCLGKGGKVRALPVKGRDSGWVEGLPDLPSRGRFLFGVGGGDADVDTCEGVRKVLEDRGAVVKVENEIWDVEFEVDAV